jgi:hypothetical protein
MVNSNPMLEIGRSFTPRHTTINGTNNYLCAAVSNTVVPIDASFNLLKVFRDKYDHKN